MVEQHLISIWATRKLGDLVEHQKGFAFKSSEYQPSGHPIVRVTNFTDRSIDMRGCNYLPFSDIKKYKAFSLCFGDVVIATVGSWPSNPESVVGKVICVPKEADGALLNQNAVRLRATDEIDQKFLFYRLKNYDFQNYIVAGAQGSASQASITLKSIFDFTFPLPPLPEQKAIAHILGTLDDKIELNQQMNQTLEAIARAIFKSWFVDFDPVRAKMEGRQPAGMDAATADLFPDEFEDSHLGKIPKGWKTGCLGDIADNARRGVQPENITLSTPYIGLEHMPRRSIALVDWGTSSEVVSNKFWFKQGDILFGKLRPYFHKIGVAVLDGVCSTDILVVVPNLPDWYSLVLFQVSSDEFVNYTNTTSTGTRMPRTNWNDMARYEIVIPTQEVAKVFNDRVQPLIQMIRENIFQSRTLATIRDTLLPKLLSGEIRVRDAEKVVEVVT